MSDDITRDSIQIARLEERMQTLARDLESQTEQMGAMRAQLEQVLTALSEARGGWRTLMLLGGAAAGAGSLMTLAINHLVFK